MNNLFMSGTTWETEKGRRESDLDSGKQWDMFISVHMIIHVELHKEYHRFRCLFLKLNVMSILIQNVLLLLNHFSHVRLCMTPQTAANRPPGPRDSPGKNTGVGCHFLLQCMKVQSESESEVVSDFQRPHGLQPTRLLRPWDFPGKVLEWGAIAFSAKMCNYRDDTLDASSAQFSRSVMSDSLRLHELQHARPSCPSPTPRVHPNSCPSSW